ncbi:MAG: HesA/MoeB/ThiF family protein, partial [Proteobacteria bacterium]|nr:HesA/MoeB/ThiF family protein [Pseudomonadota bacterium]
MARARRGATDTVFSLSRPLPRDGSGPGDVVAVPDLRHDRAGTLRLISWWRQEAVASANVMVVGAGAIGNEVIKNLALLGVGHVMLVDRDTVELANLSRSVLYRERDEGRSKAHVAAERAEELNPSVQVRALHGDVAVDVGLGVYRRMDVVIGCLDSREARLTVNNACWLAGIPWVDGAIQELFGEVRVFVPGQGACYACTLTDADWTILREARPCSGLALANVLEGKVPTTPTIASIIGAIEAQEALKIIHGMASPAGKAF